MRVRTHYSLWEKVRHVMTLYMIKYVPRTCIWRSQPLFSPERLYRLCLHGCLLPNTTKSYCFCFLIKSQISRFIFSIFSNIKQNNAYGTYCLHLLSLGGKFRQLRSWSEWEKHIDSSIFKPTITQRRKFSPGRKKKYAYFNSKFRFLVNCWFFNSQAAMAPLYSFLVRSSFFS